jgi:hypothetical protein
MKRRLFLNQLARAAAFAPLARCAWGTDTNNLPGPSVAAGFEFLHTTDWLARWQKSILKEANTRYCDTELGETVAWLTAPFLNGFYYGYCATRDVSWVARLIDWADSWLKRGVKEPDGFIGWPKKGTGSAAEEAFLTDSMLGEATCLRPVVLMADKILKTPALKDKFGSRAQAWLGLAEQIFEKWVARGCWREVMDGGLWVAPEFAIDRQTGQWTSGYARRNVDGFSNPANKENYIALWLLAMWDATQKPIYKQHAEKWFRLMKSRMRTHGEGKYYTWNYWDPAGPWDYEPNRAPRHWIGVHRNGSYEQMDLEGIVAAFEHGLVFTKEELRRLIATNRDLMWNQQFVGAKFQRVDGRLDEAGQKSWAGCLWPALVPYDESLRKVFVVSHDPASWAGLDLTPWFRARLAEGFPTAPL